jgi:uncharacterized protein involved in exopolysaccharide biosynthesis
MTANTTDVYPGSVSPNNPDEIDIRRYLLVLIKWWREILVITLFAGGITGLVIMLLNNYKTPMYAAAADILVVRLFSNIELDDRVSTSLGQGESDQNAWRASLLQMVTSSDVANTVFAEMQDDLPESLDSPTRLLSVIESEIPLSPDGRFPSNILRITAETADPELSAKIANNWAHHLVEYINGLYGEVPESMISNVVAERDGALLAYETAQKEYEDFVANNQLDSLTRQIKEKTTIRDEVMLNYTRMITSAVSTEYGARASLYDALVTAPAIHAEAMAAAQSTGNVETLTSLYRLRASAISQLNQARLMEASLEDGGEAAAMSNTIALQLLKMATFATLHNEESFPAIFSPTAPIDAAEMTLEEQLTDVRALVSVLESYVAQLEGDIKELAESNMVGADLAAIGGIENPTTSMSATGVTTHSTSLAAAYAQLLVPEDVLNQAPVDIGSTVSDAHEQLLSTLEQELNTLKAAQTAEMAKERQLLHQRDLTWTTYDAVGIKLQELNLLRSAANSEVRVGNQALVPSSPEPATGIAVPVAAVTLLAFIFAVALALVVDSLGGAPFFSRRTAQSAAR